MAFAAELLLITNQAEADFKHQKAKFQLQSNRAMDDFVESTICSPGGFMDACKTRAASRFYNIDFRVRCSQNTFHSFVEQKYGMCETLAVDALVEKLEQKLICSGFTEVSVTTHGFERQIKAWHFSLRASWATVHSLCGDVQGQTSTSSKVVNRGESVDCLVCLQSAPGVALYPCGHTACSLCARRLVNGTCPCCREWVVGATRGLYMT